MVPVTTPLRHTFIVSSATVTVDVDTRLNIKKRKERVVYRTVSSKDNINLAYVISQDTTPANNLSISDRSTSLVQNRLPSAVNYTTFTGNQFTVNTTGFVVTDTFTTETPTQPSEPLFYYHKLRYYNDDLDDFGSMTLLSLEFVDYLFEEKEVTDYYSNTSTGKVYNNLENTFDDQTYDFDITYLKYSVKNGSSISTYHELLNNKPVYEEASFDDIDDWGNIISGHKVYIVDTLPGGETYSISMPASDDYAYKEIETSRIKVLQPNAIDTSDPWYVRITNGQFITSLRRSLTDSYVHKYYLPEYDTQLFNPYPPYKNHTEQQATWLSDNLIKIPTNIVGDYTTALFTEIIVKDSSGTVVYAYTNNPAKDGDYYDSTILWDIDGILSIDDSGGFIEVADKMLDDYEIFVSYSSEEDEYEVTDVDFNPLSNTEILDYRVAFYVAPEYYATGEIDKSLYYLKIDSLGKIAYASQAEDGSTLLPSTQKLLIEDFYSDGTPRHDFYYDIESTASGLRATYSGNFSAYFNELSFIDKYTTESLISYENYMTNSGLYDGLVGSGELLENMSNNPKFLVLADVYVGEAAAPESSTVMDIRVRGGGIKEDYEGDVFDEQPEATWYWDISQKLPYPSNMAFMVEVPKTLLTEYGGDYEYDQLRTVVERHMQFGGYPIIRTYGIDPVLTSGVGWSGYIELGWPSYGSDKTYNVYYSNLETTGFVTHNSSPIADVITGNTYTMTGLSLLKDYYIYISAIDTNDYEFYGPKYKITTTAT